MDNSKFSRLAERTIALIADTIEVEDDKCLLEIDFQNDLLHITTTQGIFVINKHSAAKEIWLSSPISGPYHFYYLNGKWQTKTNDDLMLILEQELNINFSKLQICDKILPTMSQLNSI
ncbi:iron donor protein CyaY [Candidatus Tisiphia endosymbiont of Nemotelus uliginosus]|uniref:iron donor protein CyaY n=1 Tax=Candidatus Tisiphia endosymbiont of Nemotelus uliginosus TaxID=3077926 RepID=UPI0035C8D051